MIDPRNIGPGEEQYEYYKDRINKRIYCQYDYRDHDGKLYSCVRPTLEACRAERDQWKEARQP